MKKILDMDDTDVSYVGGAETIIDVDATDTDHSQFHYNPDSNRKYYFRYGIVLRVAKYKGKLFFGISTYCGESFCSQHVFVDKDFDLEKRFLVEGMEPPEWTYRTSESVDIAKGKDAIIDFAREFVKRKKVKDDNVDAYVEKVVAKFKEML